jgi:ketosteroid isomerase-like protein
MSTHKATVERYIDGFRRNDHAQILSCLADDVVWVLHGHKTLRGKQAFDAEIENDAFEPCPTINLDRFVEESDTVAVTGRGSVAKKTGEVMRFVFSEVFTFSGDVVSRLDTYHVWTEAPDEEA